MFWLSAARSTICHSAVISIGRPSNDVGSMTAAKMRLLRLWASRNSAGHHFDLPTSARSETTPVRSDVPGASAHPPPLARLQAALGMEIEEVVFPTTVAHWHSGMASALLADECDRKIRDTVECLS